MSTARYFIHLSCIFLLTVTYLFTLSHRYKKGCDAHTLRPDVTYLAQRYHATWATTKEHLIRIVRQQTDINNIHRPVSGLSGFSGSVGFCTNFVNSVN